MALIRSPCALRLNSRTGPGPVNFRLSPMRRKAAPRGDAGGFAGLPSMGYRWAMADSDEMQRILIEALDEPALIVEGLTVSMANRAALALFGDGIEGRDVRLAIRQP